MFLNFQVKEHEKKSFSYDLVPSWSDFENSGIQFQSGSDPCEWREDIVRNDEGAGCELRVGYLRRKDWISWRRLVACRLGKWKDFVIVIVVSLQISTSSSGWFVSLARLRTVPTSARSNTWRNMESIVSTRGWGGWLLIDCQWYRSQAPKKMRNSLMYKLCYHRFGQLMTHPVIALSLSYGWSFSWANHRIDFILRIWKIMMNCSVPLSDMICPRTRRSVTRISHWNISRRHTRRRIGLWVQK